jgi:hypothetical protein
MGTKTLLMAAGLTLALLQAPAEAQVRVLVDASFDGGVWWGPQGPPYDPNLPHQGKPLADFLRSQGMAVTELIPGTVVTCDRLSAYELVIALDGHAVRTPQVIAAYSGYVSNGGRLILLNEHHSILDLDSLSPAFGLDFSGAVSGVITTFTPHAITAGVTTVNYLTGSVVTTAPASATMLGFLAGQPVMGVMPFENGQIFFIGDTNGLEGVQGIIQPLVNNLFGFMLSGAHVVGACSRSDLAVDLGPAYGVWTLSQRGVWSPLHNLSSKGMVRGDLDGNGFDDLVLDFGPGTGIYAWMNHATWQFLHPFSASQMVAGDLDGNGRDELVVVFPGYGVWRLSGGTWTQLHGLEVSRLAVGQIDGVAGQDLVLDFPGYGLYAFANNTTWTGLHPLHAAAIVMADLDGNGQDEAVINFGPLYGLWAYRNNSAWQPLHGLSPVRVAAGRLDANARQDLVVDFGAAYGLWTFRNDTSWAPLHGLSAEGIVLTDRDRTGKDEIVIDFGAVYGLWQYGNDSVWSQLHGLSPDGVVPGRFH